MPASKLSPETTEQICRLIKVGNTIDVSAEAAGISRATFFAWMDRGTKKGKTNARYREFHRAVEHARAEAEATLVARIAKAAQNGSWSAAAWLLERRTPERWGKMSERAIATGDETETEERVYDPISQARDDLAERRRSRAA